MLVNIKFEYKHNKKDKDQSMKQIILDIMSNMWNFTQLTKNIRKDIQTLSKETKKDHDILKKGETVSPVVRSTSTTMVGSIGKVLEAKTFYNGLIMESSQLMQQSIIIYKSLNFPSTHMHKNLLPILHAPKIGKIISKLL